jgi:hypothetical protein
MKKERSYLEQVHHDGKVWNYSMAVVFILFPILLCIIFGVVPEWKGLLKGLLATLPLYWLVGLIEVITYVPMLGAGGAYLSFVTGNISNLKLPCALDAMDKANVKSNSEEGEIISTIAIAVSSIVTTLIIILGVVLIIPLSPILENEILAPAFDQIIPALFGALGVVFISKNWKIAIAPIILMLIVFISIPSLAGSVGVLASVGAVFTLCVSRFMYKKGWLDDKKPTTDKTLD